jgi:hypothetical protein
MILDILSVLFFVLGFALILWMIGERRRDVLHGLSKRGMKQSDLYRQNAENCMLMAEAAQGEPYNRYRRMEVAWLALAEDQDWLEDERSTVYPPEKAKTK